MYYSYYMNERLALDEWQYYDECNWLLTHLLCKDETKTIEEKLDFYIKNRHEKAENWWWYDDEQEDIENMKENVLDLWLEDREHQKEIKQEYFIKKTIRIRKMNMKLREIDRVVLYKSDFAAIDKAKKEYRLNEHQTVILFGFIFFSRMNNIKWCRVGTNYKWKSFKACFNKTITTDDLIKIKATGLIKSVDIEKGKAHKQLGEQAEYLHIESESDYVYENFDIQDEVAYVFTTTKDNNRLDLNKVAKEAMPNFKIKYCSVCGIEFIPNSNRQHMCESCKEETQKEQARLRKQKQRDREKGLLPKFEKKKKLTSKEREIEYIQSEYEKQQLEDEKFLKEIKEKPWQYC